MRQELQYFDCDDDGYGTDEKKGVKMPKWRETQTQFQVDILALFSMKHFPQDDRNAKIDLVEIERGMVPFAQIHNFNRMLQDERTLLPYPKEWVEFGMEWTKKKRNEGVPIKLRGLINFLKNRERMVNWLEKKGMFCFSQETKYENRKEILEADHASLEAIDANFDY